MKRHPIIRGALSLALVLVLLTAASVAAQGITPARVLLPTDRTVLPIPEPKYPHITMLDARNAKAPPRFEVKAPARAPNVLIVLIDDMGFGQSSAFGGPIHMPTVEKLAKDGLRYNQFHTTALCSPTRAALLTGRNHHVCNMGSITETATAFPGQTGQRPNSVAPLAEMLRLNGYSTAAFGKSHETAAWEVSPSGPTDRWPTRSGFDKFYGFIGGETNQWAPAIYEDMSRVELPKDPNYHFMTDMTNQAIKWTQCPEVADAGQAVLHLLRAGRHARAAPRAEGVDRQVQGQVRPGLGQAPRRDAGPPDRARRRSRRHQARPQARGHQGLGQAERRREEALRPPDGSLRRLRRVHRLRDRPAHPGHRRPRPAGQHAHLLRGRRQRRERRRHHERPVQRDDLLQRRARNRRGHPQALRRSGRPELLPPLRRRVGRGRRHAVRLDEAGRRQLRRHPQPLVVHWPKGIKAKGEVRSQWHHVIDIAPTILEAAGLPEPKCGERHAADAHRRREHGLLLRRRQGEGPAQDAVLRDLRQPRHLPRRLAGPHGPPRRLGEQAAAAVPRRQQWELYHVDEDFSSANDLAAKNPEKLKELQDLFLKEAVKYHVLAARRPDPRAVQRRPRRPARPDGRPHLADGLRGHDRDDGERLHQHQEPVAHHHRRGDDPEGAGPTA